jgi:hypothetical protein
MQDNNIMETIHNLQNQYYNINNKNSFFKKKQKYECADLVTNQIGIDTMLTKCIFIFDNSKIFIDYTIFKTFANPNNYHDLTLFLARTINDTIHKHKTFEIHINLDTLTISAVERYSAIITSFAEHGQNNNYDKYLTKLELYNTPCFISTTTSILNTFISPKVKNMVKFYKKSESAEPLKNILQ